MSARFEVVHTGPHKFHARFVAANNETVWVTESFRRKATAYGAIDLLVFKLATADDAVVEVDERESPR